MLSYRVNIKYTLNVMVVYSLFVFVKSVRIVPEVIGRQQTPDSCDFDIHTLLHLGELERCMGQCLLFLYL